MPFAAPVCVGASRRAHRLPAPSKFSRSIDMSARQIFNRPRAGRLAQAICAESKFAFEGDTTVAEIRKGPLAGFLPSDRRPIVPSGVLSSLVTKRSMICNLR